MEASMPPKKKSGNQPRKRKPIDKALKKLVDFTLKLATEDELREAFKNDPDTVGQRFGLRKSDIEALKSGNSLTLRRHLEKSPDFDLDRDS
jgi:hypothetical protein